MSKEIKNFEEFRDFIFRKARKDECIKNLQDRLYKVEMYILNFLRKDDMQYVSQLDIKLLAIESLKLVFKYKIEHLNNLQTKLKDNE